MTPSYLSCSDRQPPSTSLPGQPPSFKSNVNRAKTKKWVEAKSYSYDGDDWGEYDEYDEYGADNEPPPLPEPTSSRQPGQTVGSTEPGRSFTNPLSASNILPRRTNSFDAGDERRAFSSELPSSSLSRTQPPSLDTGNIATSSGGPVDFQQRRDFSPSALPPPLHTRISPAPPSATSSPAGARFPPRKSSIGLQTSPTAQAPILTSGPMHDPGKPLPFIRPADIYKRMQEERERERRSPDSEEPVMAAVTSPSAVDAGLSPIEPRQRTSSESLAPSTGRRQSLEPPQHLSADVSDSSAAPSSGLQHQPSIGFRSVVHQAFDRPDESSVPPTPVSREDSQSQTGSSVSRSNTDSTAGISPIMSRVPPAPTVEVRQRSTPAIAEESGEFITQNAKPLAPATSIVLNQIPRKPSPAHSRNASADSQPISFTPGYRRDLDTPSPGNSPARSPAIEASNQMPLPKTGEIEDSSSTDLHQPEVGLSAETTHPSINYTTREADIAHAVNSSPNKHVPGAAQAVQDSRALYLDTHRHSPAPEVRSASRAVSPIPQAESPSKGRVRDLAERFNEINSSRRNSAISVSSTNSWSSRNTSKESLSPTRETPLPRPSTADRGYNFRPKLPGEWVSYATTPGTTTPAGTEEQSHLTRSQTETSHASDDMDITPTTAKHPLSSKEAPALDTNPLAALQAAGSAMADALMASMGMGKDQEPIPPTPPPKDIRSAESPSRTSNYFASSSPPKESRLALPMQTKDLDEAQRPALVSQSSTDSSLPEAESDRLTNEIVRSLTPQPNARSAEAGNAASPIQSSWSAVPVLQHNRESTIAPREHDSYRPGGAPLNEDNVRVSENPWVDEDCDEPSPSPALLSKRFSWEKKPASDLISNATVAELASRDNMPYTERSAGLHVVNAELEPEPETPDIESAHGAPSAVVDNGPTAQQHTANSEPQVPETPASASAGAATEGQTLAATLPLVPGHASTESLHTLHATDKSSPYLSSPKQSLDSPVSPVPLRELTPTLQTGVSPVLPSTVASQSPISPSTRIPPFREILALKSTNERILTYNKTREQFAGINTGLSEWVAATLAAHPEHAEVVSQAQRPSVSIPGKNGSIKHRHSPSIMRFTKQGGSTQQGTPSASGMGQLAPGSSVGASNQGGLAGPSAGVGERRITGQHMQAKGKDLLASAGKMGGKGMVGAKGLFAKGKKRFGSGVGGGDDKVDN
ncbi:hypothetical protein BJ546DRAFT_845876 [Cryomyces antarcticus]